MKDLVIIVAGGSGTRMNSSIPKQFMELNGMPVLMHSILRFYEYDPELSIRLVLPSDQINLWKELCEKHSFTIEHECLSGGSSRFHSVKNGLANLPEYRLIAVHDGVRPLVSFKTIADCFSMALEKGAAIPVSDVYETLRQVDGENSSTVDRSCYRTVQTPQVFRKDILVKSYATDYLQSFTDDASVVEYNGFSVSMVQGNRENIKITTPFDLILAENLLANQNKKS